MNEIAIAIVLSCLGAPTGVMTRENGLQRTYNIIAEPNKPVTVAGTTLNDTVNDFVRTMNKARQQGIKTEFIEMPNCKRSGAPNGSK